MAGMHLCGILGESGLSLLEILDHLLKSLHVFEEIRVAQVTTLKILKNGRKTSRDDGRHEGFAVCR